MAVGRDKDDVDLVNEYMSKGASMPKDEVAYQKTVGRREVVQVGLGSRSATTLAGDGRDAKRPVDHVTLFSREIHLQKASAHAEFEAFFNDASPGANG